MHLDFVALREPVTCSLPTDPPGHKRLVKQFRRLELEQFEQGMELFHAGDDFGCLAIWRPLAMWAVDATMEEVKKMASSDLARLLASAQGKLEEVEAALKNAQRGGDSSSPMEAPSPTIPASTMTTTEPPSLSV